MTHRLRLMIVCAVAAASLAAVAPAAMAAFQFNNAPITFRAVSTNVTFVESTGLGSTANCSGATVSATVQRDGTGVIPRGTVAFANCSISGFGTLTFTQLGDWTVTTTPQLSGGNIVGATATFTLPPGTGARARFGLCTFDLAGTATATTTTTPTTPPALVTYGQLVFGSLTLGLVVESASGCAIAGVNVGDLARFNGVFGLSTPLIGTLV